MAFRGHFACTHPLPHLSPARLPDPPANTTVGYIAGRKRPLATAGHYRREAARVRQVAQPMPEPKLRRQLLSIASDYECLATTLDEIAETKLREWPKRRS